jgi:hypothetical protein
VKRLDPIYLLLQNTSAGEEVRLLTAVQQYIVLHQQGQTVTCEATAEKDCQNALRSLYMQLWLDSCCPQQIGTDNRYMQE